MSDLTPQEVSGLQSKAASGDSVAQAILSELGQPPAPEKKPEETNGKTGTSEPSETAEPEEVKSEVASSESAEVDKGQESKQPERRRSWRETVKELRADRRALKQTLEELQKSYAAQLEGLSKKIETFQTAQAPKSAQDVLTELLADPEKFLASREERIAKQIEALLDSRLKAVPSEFERRNEASKALEIVKKAKGFNVDTDEEEMMELMEENGLNKLAKIAPVEAANLAVKLWESRNNLPPQVVNDKKAAASSSTGGVKPSIGKPSMQELNAQYRKAWMSNNKPELERIEKLMAESAMQESVT